MFEAELVEYIKARQAFQVPFEEWAARNYTLEDVAGVYNKLTEEEVDMPIGPEYAAVRKSIVLAHPEARALYEVNEKYWKDVVAPLQVLRDKTIDALSDKVGRTLGQESAGPYFMSRIALGLAAADSQRRYLRLIELKAGDSVIGMAAQSLAKKLSELALPQAAAIAEQMKKENADDSK